MIKNDLVIAVTGLNAGENPQPGVPFIRLLRRTGFSGKIIGLVYDAYESGIYAPDLADEVYLMPYPSAGGESILARLKTVLQKTKIDVLVPTLDSELLPYISIEERLRELGIRMYLPTREMFMMRDKSRLSEFGKKYKIPVPDEMILSSTKQIEDVAEKMDMPVMVKGRFYEAYQAENEEDIEKYFEKINNKWGLPIIIQQFMKGEEYNVVAIGDGKGNITCQIPIKKVVVTEKGKGFAAVVINDLKLTHFTQKIIRALKWRGPLELEILKSAEDQKYYLLEINPRLPAWIALTAGAGQNFPEILTRLAIGEKIKPITKYKVGTLFIRHNEDIILDIGTVGKLTATGTLHNLRRN
ncbi:MAG: ATP-grasp domain-containing protein [Candidatus Latescibacteria bacterium]|nr:ATP-grasp domain-containing protein [Candidatus Latescibacterota bacterium]